jgi:hypothetical protein
MFVFAIETNGKTVALVREENRYTLDGFLNGKRKDGRGLRELLLSIEEGGGTLIWDGVSPFTARLATSKEDSDYCHELEATGTRESDSESVWFPVLDKSASEAVVAAFRKQRLIAA